MAQWLLASAIVAAALVCPGLMWLGRREVGPGCAICPPRRDDDQSLEELKARQRLLAVEVERLEAGRSTPLALTRD